MKIYYKSLITTIYFFVFVGVVFAFYDNNDLRLSIIALEKTRDTIIEELKIHKLSLLTNKEKNEYEMFVDYIDGQISYYCKRLYQNNDLETINDLPCKETYGNYNDLISTELKTTDEQIALMEDSLMSSLGDFDEMLLKEDETLNQKTSGKNKLENKSELEKYLETSGKNNDSQTKQSDMHDKDSKGEKYNIAAKDSNRSEKNGMSGNTSGIESKHKNRKIQKADDDIVARQLREAAEKESDPELKKKLWEEYEKYKQNNI